jgi:N-acyl-phosphatidylethanolamine-hydrolysing phospholipase D
MRWPCARAALALLAILAATGACGSPGRPRPERPAHHVDGGFRNLNPEYARPPARVRWPFILSHVVTTTFAPRRAALPVLANDGRALRANRTEATLTWVGHSTLLVQLDGMTLLTDPHWSERASPVAFGGPRRVTPPGLAFEDLPAVDLVLVSHDHYDHLDEATVQRLWTAHRPRFLVPLGLRGWLAGRGIDPDAVEELDWWETRVVRGLLVTLVPAQHWSARSLWDVNRRLWGGFVVTGPRRRLYFAGDSGYYRPMLEEIGQRLGPFDVVAMPIGAYRPAAMMRLSHTTPEEALQALADVGGRHLVPIHWGTFDLADEPIGEPPVRLAAEAERLGLARDRIWLLRHGETRAW